MKKAMLFVNLKNEHVAALECLQGLDFTYTFLTWESDTRHRM